MPIKRLSFWHKQFSYPLGVSVSSPELQLPPAQAWSIQTSLKDTNAALTRTFQETSNPESVALNYKLPLQSLR